MVWKICFVAILGCVLTRANPLVSKFERDSAEGATIDDGIQTISEESAAMAAVGLKISSDMIEAFIKGLVEALPNAISEAMNEQLALPNFKLSEELRKLVRDATTTVTRELRQAARTVKQIMKAPMR